MAAKTLSGDIADLRKARALPLKADRRAPIGERLARLHALCKQPGERPLHRLDLLVGRRAPPSVADRV